MILRLTAAAKLCGIDRTTLWRWSQSDPRVTRAIFRPGWYSVEKLADAGLCAHPKPGTTRAKRSVA